MTTTDSRGPLELPIAVFAIPAGMMLIALFDLPYGYYQLLRLVTAIAGAWIVYIAWQGERTAWATAIGIVVLLFNPLVPVHFDRETWSILNVASAAVLIAAAWVLTRSPKPGEGS